MLKLLGLKLLASAVNMIFTKALFEKVANLVRAKMDMTLSGDEKKALVKKEAADIKDHLKSRFGEWSGVALNAMIELALVLVTKLDNKIAKP